MGLGGYRDRSRKWKKAPHLGCGQERGNPRAQWTIQRAGCIDSISLDGDVNYLTSRKPERMGQRMCGPKPTSSTASYEANYRGTLEAMFPSAGGFRVTTKPEALRCDKTSKPCEQPTMVESGSSHGKMAYAC